MRAAPLDALLSAFPGDESRRGVEFALDAVNDRIDVFGVRASDPEFTGTGTGDYRGGHLRATLPLGSRAWLEGTLWRRDVSYRDDWGRIDSWALAGQWRLLDDRPRSRALALRFGAWGNEADALEKTSATAFGGRRFDSVRIGRPRDRQLQLDLVGSLGSEQRNLSAFVGLQRGTVSYGSLSGTATIGSCRYALHVGAVETSGNQLGPCILGDGTQVTGSTVRVPNSELGFDPRNALAYEGRALRFGLAGITHLGHWRFRAGATLELHDRGARLDEVTRRAGVAPRRRVATAALEAGYRFSGGMLVYARGTLFDSNLSSEVPFLYNAATAQRMSRIYGYLTLGLILPF
ncbi:MAG: hypothetical protein H3C59_01500 [Burkholderiaceae bacterium]|nr:hypothetical protein [Burkholderiaceae bacterium]